jgi:hypothetical protein
MPSKWIFFFRYGVLCSSLTQLQCRQRTISCDCREMYKRRKAFCLSVCRAVMNGQKEDVVSIAK